MLTIYYICRTGTPAARGSGEGGRARFNIHTQIHRSLGSFAHERECVGVPYVEARAAESAATECSHRASVLRSVPDPAATDLQLGDRAMWSMRTKSAAPWTLQAARLRPRWVAVSPLHGLGPPSRPSERGPPHQHRTLAPQRARIMRPSMRDERIVRQWRFCGSRFRSALSFCLLHDRATFEPDDLKATGRTQTRGLFIWLDRPPLLPL